MAKKAKKAKSKPGLNPQQRLFAREYLKDFNATAAAIRAGYSAESAHTYGHELLKKPEIQAEIASVVSGLLAAEEVQIRRILQELYIVALADIGDFVVWKDPVEAAPTEDFNPETGERADSVPPTIIQMRSKSEIGEKSRAIASLEETSTGYYSTKRKFKLHDKMKAIELIGKYLGMFKENVALSNPDGSLRPIVNFYIPENSRGPRKA